jgi:uncharacterized membrane protein
MALLVFGVLLWSGTHMLPIFAAPLRARVADSLGNAYPGVFSLSILASIVAMVFGWRATVPSPLYVAPGVTVLLTDGLMFVALLLFIASGVPTNLKRILRHPQLTGVALWAAAHLLSNGDSRSIVLFGGLGLWAVVAMFGINRRDGAWEKPEALPMSAELKPLVGALVVYALLFFAHPWIAGVSPMPR